MGIDGKHNVTALCTPFTHSNEYSLVSVASAAAVVVVQAESRWLR